MFDLNANLLASAGLTVIAGIPGCVRIRRSHPNESTVAVAKRRAGHLLFFLLIGMLWGLALNALGLHWASLAGYGVGLLVALAGLLSKLVFQWLWGRLGERI